MNNKEYAEGLRLLADWYEANSEVVNPGHHQNFMVSSKEQAVLIVKALGHCEKEYCGDVFKIKRSFANLDAEFVFLRSEVCTRVVIGKETIPAQITPEYTKEIVKWECHPVLEAANVTA